MINLKLRTEYTFRSVYGPLEKVIACTSSTAGICDRNGTWGHVAWSKAMKKEGRKPLFGVEIGIVADAKLREKQGTNWMSFLAVNNKGLKELYELVTHSTEPENFYYTPRLDYSHLFDISENIIILSGPAPVWGSLPNHKNLFVELSPSSQLRSLEMARNRRMKVVATSDNFYPTLADKKVYEVISGRERQNRTTAMHILPSEMEWRVALGGSYLSTVEREAFDNQKAIADLCSAELPRATMVHFENMPTLEKMCKDAAKKKGVNLKNKMYSDRLKRELDLIHEKQFEDYFYLVTDIITYAKQHMLVGPARGSSCGSLVCYLLDITTIDPMPYDLLFERFIDINRKDLPDIDIDFPDDRREMVFEYMRRKYGADCVARLGTVLRYKAKSTITEVAMQLDIPQWEVTDLKNAIIERSGGDARAAFCILDTFEQLEVGKKILEKYPQMKIAAQVENHAKSSGQHAAGMVVTADPVFNYCSVDMYKGAAQIDKKDAEVLDLLKIDALGLRTLSVIQDCLDAVGWTREQLIAYPTNDKKAFDILNAQKYSGIFQFEGYALQSLAKQLTIEGFEDIASLTALARPGPLESGGAAEFLKRRTGKSQVVHLHKSIADITRVTYGIVIYQEQVMQIARNMGKLSWEDVSSLRKAMSKSLGKEFFDQYYERFRKGAAEQGVSEEDAAHTWHQINTMGSWSFNRSHAVAYAMVSYWTMVLKVKFPLEFACSCLRNVRDEEQGIRLIRELVREGYEYKPFDAELSEKNWTVKDGKLIGGLLNVKGVGEKTADLIMAARRSGDSLPTGVRTKLANGQTPYDMAFECDELWGDLKKHPENHNIKSQILDIEQITEEDEGEVVILGKIKAKDLRDLNDPNAVKKRNGQVIQGQSLTLNLVVEDDTANIRVRIDRHNYITLGLPLVEKAKLGDWYLWKGNVSKGFRSIKISKYRKLTPDAPVNS